jgi:hypothetical protein
MKSSLVPCSSAIWATTFALAIAGCGSKREPNANPLSNTAAAQAAPAKKGPGRIGVEHGLDADVAKVDQTPQPISVEQLLAFRDRGTGKINLDNYHARRVAPFETTTFEVAGTIKYIKHEKDGDFYFALQGKSGAQAIIEVPDPKLCVGSPLLPRIAAARRDLEKRYHPTETPRNLNEEITVDGVGFLGSRRKPGSGSFGSSVRLMPGTGVKFPTTLP